MRDYRFRLMQQGGPDGGKDLRRQSAVLRHRGAAATTFRAAWFGRQHANHHR